MSIDPKQVMQLRAATGLPMMKCKKALVAEDGDFEKAIERLRKEGLKAADTKADRPTGEGIVRARISDDGKHGTMVTVLCESEPVRNTPIFSEFVDRLLAHIDEKAPASIDDLLAQPWIDDADQTVDEIRRGLIAKLGENITVHKLARVQVDSGLIGTYVHFNEKAGALSAIQASKVGDELVERAKELSMHIVSEKPLAMLRDEIPADIAQKELEIYRENVMADPKNSKKPKEVIEKIIDGKLKAFYRERVLLEQPWFKDQALTVGDVLKKDGADLLRFELQQVGL